jgi:hypothetical protein
MPKYTGQFQINPNTKLKDLVSLQELPRIFVNVTKAIGMFVDIWLGKDVDPTCLYNPKPSTVTMNDQTSSRPFAQSIRGNPSVLPSSGTLKATKTQSESRRSNVK